MSGRHAGCVAVGNVFSSPSADDMLVAAKETNAGAGVLYLLEITAAIK